jgi:hypothetical protein
VHLGQMLRALMTNINTDITLTKPLNAELNPICHLLALLGAHHILYVSRIRVKPQILLHSTSQSSHVLPLKCCRVATGNPVVFTLSPPECYMEIRHGYGTSGDRVGGPVRVGDPLTLIIYMRSKYGKYF